MLLYVLSADNTTETSDNKEKNKINYPCEEDHKY